VHSLHVAPREAHRVSRRRRPPPPPTCSTCRTCRICRVDYTFCKKIKWAKTVRPRASAEPFRLECGFGAVALYTDAFRGVHAHGRLLLQQERDRPRDEPRTESPPAPHGAVAHEADGVETIADASFMGAGGGSYEAAPSNMYAMTLTFETSTDECVRVQTALVACSIKLRNIAFHNRDTNRTASLFINLGT
jgi:hypothetical protein